MNQNWKRHLPTVFVWLCILFAFQFRIRWLTDQVYDWHSWRQSETIMIIEAFFRFGVDLFRPQVGWLGDYRTYPFELPISQAIVSILWKFFGNHIWIAKALYLFLYSIGCVYLYLTVAGKGTHSWARWALFYYLIMPLSMYYSIGLQVDFFEVSACLGCLFHSSVYRQKGNWSHLVAFGLWFVIAGVEKPPYLLCVGLSIVYLYVSPINWRRLGWLFISSLPGFAATVSWILYSDKLMHSGPPLAFLHGFNRNQNMMSWYFGTLDQRFNSEYWYAILDRSLLGFSFIVAVASLVGFVLALVDKTRGVLFWLWSAIGTILMVMIIFNLQIWHDYYQIPLLVPLAVFAGYALSCLERKSIWLVIACTILTIHFSLETLRRSPYYFRSQIGVDEVGSFIQKNTNKDELILILNQPNPSNNPIIHAAARRFGYSLDWDHFKISYFDSVQAHRVHKAVIVNHYDPLPSDVLARLTLRKSELTPIGFKVEIYDIKPQSIQSN